MVGAVEIETVACACGGTQTRARTCEATCTWGTWGAWDTCAPPTPMVCSPGVVEREQQRCGTTGCGLRTRTRTCSATTCTWDPWTDYGSCMGDVACWSMSASAWRCVGSTGGSWTCCPDGDWHMGGC